MSNPVDTLSEAVERLAFNHIAWAAYRPFCGAPPATVQHMDVAATLRALLAERDAALAQIAASEAKMVTMIEAREGLLVDLAAVIGALPSGSPEWMRAMTASTPERFARKMGARHWSGDFRMRITPEIEVFKHLAGAGKTATDLFERERIAISRVDTLEQRVAALEERMRNR